MVLMVYIYQTTLALRLQTQRYIKNGIITSIKAPSFVTPTTLSWHTLCEWCRHNTATTACISYRGLTRQTAFSHDNGECFIS